MARYYNLINAHPGIILLILVMSVCLLGDINDKSIEVVFRIGDSCADLEEAAWKLKERLSLPVLASNATE